MTKKNSVLDLARDLGASRESIERIRAACKLPISSLTGEQKQWVKEQHGKYSWRRLAQEFNKVWPYSFEPIQFDGFTDYSQEDGQWLCEEANEK